MAGAGLSAGTLTWLLFERLTPLRGAPGFLLCYFALFLVICWLIANEAHGRQVANDRVASILMTSGALLAFSPAIIVGGYIVAKGAQNLHWSFFTDNMSATGPLAPATVGGAFHAIVGTVEQVGIATIITVPLGILTAVYLNEVRGRLTQPIRIITQALTALPSVVAGLFVYSLWILRLDHGFSGIAGAAALTLLILPTVVITAEQVLRVVPGGLREAALALGAPQWRAVLRVVLPTARAGLLTAAILAVARAAGETAPVLLTSFGSRALNNNPLADPQENLPLYIYSQVRSAQGNAVERAWLGAFVLVALVLLLFIATRLLIAATNRGLRFPGPRTWFRKRPSRPVRTPLVHGVDV